MATPRFDPSYSVEFDLGRGQIAVRGSSERVLIPADALAALCEGCDPEVRRDFARRVGTEAGRRAAERLGDPSRAEIETVVEQLGGDLALMGLGSLGLERWGRALVLSVSGSPFGAAGDELLAGVLEGALQRAFGRDVGAVRLVRDDARTRFLISSRAGSERVRDWLNSGTPWSEALTRLDRGGGNS
ncbi:MAG TPA: hypothetical protein VG937_12455 [Polyangiaceae bacterium]|nr:hypothetical protein [Polyangiaceae bacterium]